MKPLVQIELLSPGHFLRVKQSLKQYKQEVVHHGVVVNALHESADADKVVRVLLHGLERTISNGNEIAVNTLHSTEVSKGTPDELLLNTRFEGTLFLLSPALL